MIESRIKLRPFMVPNFVSMEMPARPRQEGFGNAPQFSLGELDTETLNALCDEFRMGVHARAAEQRKVTGMPTSSPSGQYSQEGKYG